MHGTHNPIPPCQEARAAFLCRFKNVIRKKLFRNLLIFLIFFGIFVRWFLLERNNWIFLLIGLALVFASVSIGGAIPLLLLKKDPEAYNNSDLGVKLTRKLSDEDILTSDPGPYNLSTNSPGRKYDQSNINAYHVYLLAKNQGKTEVEANLLSFRRWCQDKGITTPTANDRKNFKNSMNRIRENKKETYL